MIQFDADRGGLRFSSLLDRGLPHVVTTRLAGASEAPYDRANLGFGVDDSPRAVIGNRQSAIARIGLKLDDLAVGYQVHGDRIAEVGSADRGRGARDRATSLPETDSMLTRTPGVGLLTMIADCSALVLYAPDVPAVGVAHLGWRGTVARLGEKLARRMIEELGADPRSLAGAVSPGIGPCCYEVGDNVVGRVAVAFPDRDGLIASVDGKTIFDIPAAILAQLDDSGVPPESVELSGLCTSCRTDLFYSHRAERGLTGRFGLLAALPGAA